MQNMQHVICGPDWKTIAIRHNEHIHYIKTNNPVSAYALHIFNNRQEYGSPKHTMQLLQTCDKGKMMNCWESFYMQTPQQQDLLINEQKTYRLNLPYALGDVTKLLNTQYIPGSHSDNICTRVTLHSMK